MKSAFHARGDGLERLKAATRQLAARPHVKVGVLGEREAATKKQLRSSAASRASIGVVELATIHEFGAPRAGIPQRSFLRDTADLKREAWLKTAERLVKLIARGKLTVERALGLLGEKASGDVKRRIKSGTGIPPELQPATIRAKGSSRPLVDTGRLVNSISYQVVAPKR